MLTYLHSTGSSGNRLTPTTPSPISSLQARALALAAPTLQHPTHPHYDPKRQAEFQESARYHPSPHYRDGKRDDELPQCQSLLSLLLLPIPITSNSLTKPPPPQPQPHNPTPQLQ
ncbi:uncharacterized protein EI97DRAFT_434667 [Westerdykella ornata]|uniref:Uncharacterized protein n=1 Tax=Westerdykella ornata TaxID=318751 RepID=A0A6A6JFB4_WESOR|nr:uncharacterized protein EI97DRAFT_434667 [Westerdykella ornata]KAF2275102.1 hypothetical protein EI97DRAFT_434667 [Westerdykella ornata]